MSNWWTRLTQSSGEAREDKKRDKRDEKRETPDGLWIKDPISGELIYQPDLEAAHWVTPTGFHMRIGPDARFKQLFDEGFEKIPLPEVVKDPLRFKDDKRYVDRLLAARRKVGRDDCMDAAIGLVGGVRMVILVQDFDFMGGSLGMAAGEAFVTAAQRAVREGVPMVCITASGGARMQEGILSLMQMPRTTLAIEELREAGLPYVVVHADPTTGGVTASYAMLGDLHLAEPGALIGFAGPRVIENTIRQKLPDGFQRSEYLLEKGMVDMVVDRRQLKQTLSSLLGVLMAGRTGAGEAPAAAPEDAASLPAPRRRLEGPRPIRSRAAE